MKPGSRLLSIHYLRAFAAILVLIFHAVGQLQRLGLPAPPVEWLGLRLEIFFVISGAVVWMATAETRTAGPPRASTFLWRRIVRIAPAYWLVTTLVVAVGLAAPGVLRSTALEPAHVAASYLFLPWEHPVLGEAFPVLVPGWTLQCEMAFYVIFALTLRLPRGARFWAVGSVLMALYALAHLLPEPSLMLRFYGSDLMPLFWLGMLLGRLILSGPLPGACLSVLFIAAALLLAPAARTVADPGVRGLITGIMAGAIVAGAVGLEAAGRVRAWRLPLVLGELSYGIYLLHALVLAALTTVWARLSPPGAGVLAGSLIGPMASAAYILVALLLSVAGAAVLHRMVELPLRRAFRRRQEGLALASPGAVSVGP